jgi:hypothetical protein
MTAALFAAGGTGFALGNLLLARLLPESEYGYLSLSLSFVQLGHALGPLGLEIIINRRRLGPSPALLRRAASTSAAVGIAMGWGSPAFSVPRGCAASR